MSEFGGQSGPELISLSSMAPLSWTPDFRAVFFSGQGCFLSCICLMGLCPATVHRCGPSSCAVTALFGEGWNLCYLQRSPENVPQKATGPSKICRPADGALGLTSRRSGSMLWSTKGPGDTPLTVLCWVYPQEDHRSDEPALFLLGSLPPGQGCTDINLPLESKPAVGSAG